VNLYRLTGRAKEAERIDPDLLKLLAVAELSRNEALEKNALVERLCWPGRRSVIRSAWHLRVLTPDQR